MLDQSSLLLDVGNTSIKYAWYQYPNDIADLQIMRTSIDSLATLIQNAENCWLCSVVNDKQNEAIKKICDSYSVPLIQAKTQTEQFGVENSYKTTSNMGSDRWMAIIAGAALSNNGTNNNYIVIDSGTAITCDFVIGNKHIGGWIAPGLSLAREAVVKQTTKVFDNQQVLSELDLGDDTPQCVAYGALAQLSGMMFQAINLMQQKCQKFEIYMSGGDAPLLIHTYTQTRFSQLLVNINYLENLVIIGLAKVAHEKIALNA